MQSETLESMPDVIVAADGRGIITQVNQQTIRLGHEASDLVGAPVERLLPERLRTAHETQREGYFDDPRISNT